VTPFAKVSHLGRGGPSMEHGLYALNGFPPNPQSTPFHALDKPKATTAITWIMGLIYRMIWRSVRTPAPGWTMLPSMMSWRPSRWKFAKGSVQILWPCLVRTRPRYVCCCPLRRRLEDCCKTRSPSGAPSPSGDQSSTLEVPPTSLLATVRRMLGLYIYIRKPTIKL